MNDLIKLGIRNVRKKKLRSWLTMIGIFVSVAIIFVLVSLSLGLGDFVEAQFEELGADVFFIMPRGQTAGPGTPSSVLLTEDDVNEIADVPGVKEVTYGSYTNAKVEYRNEIRFVMVSGMPEEGFEFFEGHSSFVVEDGELLSSGDRGRVIIGSQYAVDLFSRQVRVGDSIEVNDVMFRVNGIMKATGSPPDDKIVYMIIEDFRETFNITEQIDQIYIRAEEGTDLREVIERVDEKLMSSRGVNENNKDYTILAPEDLLESFNNILNIITGFLLGIAAISLLVGAIGIANTMYTSVLERTKEIGVMKSVGARNRDVFYLFALESGVLGLIGGVIGVALGILFAKIIEAIAFAYLGAELIQAASPWWLILGCIAFAFVAGVVSGVLPAKRATKIKPTEALRYE